MKFSASQVSKYRRCHRMYGFEYVQGLFPPSSPKQQFGTAVHSQLEAWLSKCIAPDDSPEGACAKQGIQWLPAPSDSLLVEHKFTVPWAPRIVMGGIVDCVSPNDRLVIDHKTTSDLRWMQTPEQLESDPQAIIYAVWAMLHLDIPQVKARWVYYAASNPKNGPRKPRGSEPVEILFSARDPLFQAKVNQLTADLNAMLHIREAEIPGLKLEPNPGACQMYGGCPHLERCDLQPEDAFQAFLERDSAMAKQSPK